MLGTLISDYDDIYMDGPDSWFTGAMVGGKWYYKVYVMSMAYWDFIEMELYLTDEDWDNGHVTETRKYSVELTLLE